MGPSMRICGPSTTGPNRQVHQVTRRLFWASPNLLPRPKTSHQKREAGRVLAAGDGRPWPPPPPCFAASSAAPPQHPPPYYALPFAPPPALDRYPPRLLRPPYSATAPRSPTCHRSPHPSSSSAVTFLLTAQLIALCTVIIKIALTIREHNFTLKFSFEENQACLCL